MTGPPEWCNQWFTWDLTHKKWCWTHCRTILNSFLSEIPPVYIFKTKIVCKDVLIWTREPNSGFILFIFWKTGSLLCPLTAGILMAGLHYLSQTCSNQVPACLQVSSINAQSKKHLLLLLQKKIALPMSHCDKFLSHINPRDSFPEWNNSLFHPEIMQ